MNLYIKNMVCNRCNIAVEDSLKKAGVHPVSVTLGEVALQEEKLSADKQKEIAEALRHLGFELIDNKRGRIIEKIKTLIINTIHYSKEAPKHKFSELIAAGLHYDYSYLSKLFSDVEGITIEHYIIVQKIEKIKELLVYAELSLSEIADLMGYSSVAHLSAQFKKITGLPPSHFKNTGKHQRQTLDKIGGK